MHWHQPATPTTRADRTRNDACVACRAASGAAGVQQYSRRPLGRRRIGCEAPRAAGAQNGGACRASGQPTGAGPSRTRRVAWPRHGRASARRVGASPGRPFVMGDSSPAISNSSSYCIVDAPASLSDELQQELEDLGISALCVTEPKPEPPARLRCSRLSLIHI